MEKLMDIINGRQNDAISEDKAYRLFWLGRYAERVYMSLHLLRKYFDADIDGATAPYELYCKKLNISFNSASPEDDVALLLYGEKILNSLFSGLVSSNDNALVLRVELGSETLSYIQMALCHMRLCAEIREMNITELQSITDNLMAFWGSADERILNKTVKNFMYLGRFLERLDMEIRFGYAPDRILKTYLSMRKFADRLPKACDENILKELDGAMFEMQSAAEGAKSDDEILTMLWSLFKI